MNFEIVGENENVHENDDGQIKWVYFCSCNLENAEVIESLGIDTEIQQNIEGYLIIIVRTRFFQNVFRKRKIF